jgi:hypothetical protein
MNRERIWTKEKNLCRRTGIFGMVKGRILDAERESLEWEKNHINCEPFEECTRKSHIRQLISLSV